MHSHHAVARPSWLFWIGAVATSMLLGDGVDAGTIVLSQTTSGLTWAPGEGGFNDYVDLNTSGGGPFGPADATLVLEVLAPAGQVFSLNGSAYASESGISFVFRPILGFSGSTAGLSFSPPTFSLIGASGVGLGSAAEQTWDASQASTVYLSTIYPFIGNGTFSGFRLTTTLTGPYSGQTISWQGGDASASNTVTLTDLNPNDVGPVLSLVPEPSALILALAGLACGCTTVWRRCRAYLPAGLGLDRERLHADPL